MNIIIGYKDARGLTAPITIAGPGVSREKQMEIWLNAKRKHKFPKDIIRLVLCEIKPDACAIFIGDHVSDEAEAYAVAASSRLEQAKKKKKDEAKFSADLSAAIKSIGATAVSRNSAQAKLNSARQRLEQAKQFTIDAKKDFPASATDKELLKRFENAQSDFDVADKAWLAAKQAKEDLEKQPAK